MYLAWTWRAIRIGRRFWRSVRAASILLRNRSRRSACGTVSAVTDAGGLRRLPWSQLLAADDQVGTNPPVHQAKAVSCPKQLTEVTPHYAARLLRLQPMQSREGEFYGDHVAGPMRLRPRAVAEWMVGLSEQTVDRKMAERTGSPEHRRVDREVTAQLDCSPGRRGIAEPPVQHNAGHRVQRQLIEDLLRRPVTVQAHDPWFVGEDL
jgi:hypothetical protein